MEPLNHKQTKKVTLNNHQNCSHKYTHTLNASLRNSMKNEEKKKSLIKVTTKQQPTPNLTIQENHMR